MSEATQLCTFFVDSLFLGIEVEKVQEITRYQQMTRVPLAPAVVGGLINLRGQIVTAIDLRRRLDLSDRPAEMSPLKVEIQKAIAFRHINLTKPLISLPQMDIIFMRNVLIYFDISD
jgi:chemotaxis signal transduction protein